MTDTSPPESPPQQPAPLIHVAAAALVDDQRRVLLAKRPDHVHQGGLWEFPGGKLEPGESIAQGLVREIREELGITIRDHRPLIRVRHDYADRAVLLDVHRVEAWDGEPHGREGQALNWVALDELDVHAMPPADVPIVTALQLPDAYVITPPDIVDHERMLAELAASLERGARLFQLRVFDRPAAEFVELGRAFCARCHEQGAQVMLNGTLTDAEAIGADGLHLNSRQLSQYDARPDFPGLLAASCHSIGQLRHAESIGADFAVLSPVRPTRSHPDAEPLGWDRFAALVDQIAIPVYALGGMDLSQRAIAWQHGGQGVAGIRGLWGP
jgi:8-oxo-dGTP diphosphatase